MNSSSSAGSHGQCCGRCRTRHFAERAIRAGVLISWVRMVAMRARACKREASAPVARVRLCVIAAQASQAALALKYPEGRCASALFFRPVMTFSMRRDHGGWPRRRASVRSCW